MKIVINVCYGGFGLSHKAIMRYAELKGITVYPLENNWSTSYYTVPYEVYEAQHKEDKVQGNYTKSNAMCLYDRDIERNDPVLVHVVEELGEEANNQYSELKIVEIPDDVQWEIEEYDGCETIHEVHRTWG